MSNNVNNFVRDFQDMFVIKENTVRSFPNNLTEVEAALIDLQLEDIRDKLYSLSQLTLKGSEENLQEYKKVVEVLTDKLDYLENLSDMLLYINSFYDMDNVLTIKNYDLKNSSQDAIIYDNNVKGLTLRHVANSFDCPKDLNDGLSFTYYNTNLSYHSGIILNSPYLDLLNIKSIVVIKSDGTTIRLPLSDFHKNSYYIEHEFLSSTQVVVEFNNNILSLSEEEQEYYKSLKLSLVDYEYVTEGSVVLDTEIFETKRLLNFINSSILPNDCFINMNLVLDLLDVNENKINTVSLCLPVGGQEVCKRLDRIDFDEVSEILGIYINNKYKKNIRDKIKKEYLESLSNKNEVYIIYLNKQKEEDVLNNYLKVLNNQGIVLNNKNIKNIVAYTNLDFFTFNKNLSPSLKMLLGVSKE